MGWEKVRVSHLETWERASQAGGQQIMAVRGGTGPSTMPGGELQVRERGGAPCGRLAPELPRLQEGPGQETEGVL